MRPTPQSTIDAVIISVRERGVAALDEPLARLRLSDFDQAAYSQLNGALERMGIPYEFAGPASEQLPHDEWQPPTEIPDGPPDVPELQPAPTGELELIDIATWADREPPPREWLVPDRIPAGKVTLLTGDGAAGKTTIAMQLAAATVPGGPGSWLNAVVERRGPVLFFSGEEDGDEIHRRIAGIALHHGLTLAALAGLHVEGRPGKDSLLGIADRTSIVRPTALFDSLARAAGRLRPVLIVIEAAADVFAVNEIDRGHARQSIGLLNRLCADGAAVLLISHPSLDGMRSGSGMSGSTGWSNSVRSRLYFKRAKTDDEEERGDDVRELRVMKANYGPAGEAVRVRWQNGVFVPEGGAGTLATIAAEADADHAYLACLDAATAQGRNTCSQPGRSYAPAMFEDMPQAQGLRKRAFERAQERLFAAARIHVIDYGPPSKRRSRIARLPIVLQEAAE